MPIGLFGYFGSFAGESADRAPGPMKGKRRGVTKSPGRAKRRNRRKP